MGTRAQQAKILRNFRKLHRITGAISFAFFFIILITGLLLGWKKNSNGLLLPKTETGTSVQLDQWISIDSIHNIATDAFAKKNHTTNIGKVDRIDIRKDKGIAKISFQDSYFEIQIDGSTGDILHEQTRYSDIIEDIHDGSIIDRLLGFNNGIFKLFYCTLMGLALLIFTVTGFWIWFGQKRLKKTAVE